MLINSILIRVVSIVIVKLYSEVIAYRSMPIYKSVYRRPVRLQFYEPKYLVFSRLNSTCTTNIYADYYVTSNYNSNIKSFDRQVKPLIVTIPNHKKQREAFSEKISGKFVPLGFRQESSTGPEKNKLIKIKLIKSTFQNHDSDPDIIEKSSEIESSKFKITSEEFHSTPDITTNNDIVPTYLPLNDGHDVLATVGYPPSMLEATSDDLPLINDDTLSIAPSAGTEILTNGDLLDTTVALTNYNLLPTSDDSIPTKYEKNITFSDIKDSLDQFERKFYNVTFLKLLTTSPDERRENGISFAISGLFLYMILLSLASEVDRETRNEIENVTGFPLSNSDGSYFIREIISTLPLPYEALKFYWTCRLIHKSLNISESLESGPAAALSLHLSRLYNSDSPEIIAKILNRMVEIDSKGAMHNTFEEQDISEGVKAIILSTVYVRARWRSAPTLLNDTRPFHDAEETAVPPRTTRMIRINDVMGYANLTELGAEILEISYATPGLSLVMVVPYGRSLRAVAAHAGRTGVDYLLRQMTTKRIAATLPLYTLRMTLLLPKKLQAMGMSRLVNTTDYKDMHKLRISHAVQRLMFWSEAGRNAFKDDGIEWDQPPEQELIVDRPYVFYVRWHNITIMSGNFAL